MRLFCCFFALLMPLLFLPSVSCAEAPCRRVLFVMTALEIGGAEHAFISLMNGWTIPNTKIEILLLTRGGVLEPRLRKDLPVISLKEGLSHFYDTVVCFGEWMNPKSYMRKIHAARKVQWIHTDLATSTASQFFRRRDLCEGIDAFVCVSARAAESFRALHPHLKEKIFTIYNIFDGDSIKSRSLEENPQFPKDGFCNVVSVGRLHCSKAFDRAISVHSRLDKEGIFFRWYIVGEGAERGKLEQKIKECKLEKKFILLGQKTNPYPYLAASDLFVLPSLFEGCSVAVNEAKVFARPILLTDVGGAREQIRSEKNGLIVANNEDAIYQGLKRLLRDEKLRQKFSASLQGFVYDNQSIYRQVETILFK